MTHAFTLFAALLAVAGTARAEVGAARPGSFGRDSGARRGQRGAPVQRDRCRGTLVGSRTHLVGRIGQPELERFRRRLLLRALGKWRVRTEGTVA